jgi:RsiW-degrading membrane proteinase PrsW (M82 family)
MTFLVGCGIIWYCWTQAKEKNRNPWLWAALSFILGFLPLLVLVYLKKLPDKTPNESSGGKDEAP